MKIAICGSLKAHQKILETRDSLEALGHQITIPFGTKKIESNDWSLDNLQAHKDEFKSFALIAYFDEIKKVDAILVVNQTKGKIDNYIGGNTLMEMGMAYYFKKIIYLLNPVPDMAYTEEIVGVKPILLNGNLRSI